MYRLEGSSQQHQHRLDSLLQHCSQESQDLTLLSQEGEAIQAKAFLLTLHSPSFRALMDPLPSYPLYVSVPASSSSLSSLLLLLTEGQVIRSSRKELGQVQEAAKVLGISLTHWQVGQRRRTREDKVEGEEGDSHDPFIMDETFEHIDIGTNGIKEEKLVVEAEVEEQVDEIYSKKDALQPFMKTGYKSITITPISSAEEGIDQEASGFTCTDCGKQYLKRSHLTRHALSHKQNVVSCSECLEDFDDKFRYAQHLTSFTCHVGTKFQCEECPKAYARKDKLSSHIRKEHIVNEAPLATSNGEDTMNNDSLNVFVCKVCPKSFKSTNARSRHNISTHSESVISCNECGKVVSRSDKLNDHMRRKHKLL